MDELFAQHKTLQLHRFESTSSHLTQRLFCALWVRSRHRNVRFVPKADVPFVTLQAISTERERSVPDNCKKPPFSGVTYV